MVWKGLLPICTDVHTALINCGNGSNGKWQGAITVYGVYFDYPAMTPMRQEVVALL
jgi:hypothetical protein